MFLWRNVIIYSSVETDGIQSSIAKYSNWIWRKSSLELLNDIPQCTRSQLHLSARGRTPRALLDPLPLLLPWIERWALGHPKRFTSDQRNICCVCQTRKPWLIIFHFFNHSALDCVLVHDISNQYFDHISDNLSISVASNCAFLTQWIESLAEATRSDLHPSNVIFD